MRVLALQRVGVCEKFLLLAHLSLLHKFEPAEGLVFLILHFGGEVHVQGKALQSIVDLFYAVVAAEGESDARTVLTFISG